MNPVADNTVVDREIDAEKSQGPSDPRIRCPLCSCPPAKKTDGFVTADTNGTRSIVGHLPRVPTPMDFDTVPLMRPLVGALRMVCAVTRSRAAANSIPLPKPKPRLCASISSCLRFAAERSLRLIGLASGTAKMRSSHSISAMVCSASIRHNHLVRSNGSGIGLS
jgi:hypothetical protein